MHRTYRTERLIADSSAHMERAAAILREGGTVAFPTETVYGLGASAFSDKSVAAIFTAKQRPAWDPLIVHISDREMLAGVAEAAAGFPAHVENLMRTFWPGPMTLLLPRTSAVRDAVTAGRPLVGVRMPAHPVALKLIQLAGVPLAAPSANRFGHTSPTTAAHVLADLDGRIDAVLDGGATTVGIESTVLAPMQVPFTIYRPGAVTADMIEQATGCPVKVFRAKDAESAGSREGLPSPGVGLRHYAPRAALELVRVGGSGELTQSLYAAIRHRQAARETVGVMLPEGWNGSNAEESFSLGEWGDHETFAQRLFAGFRELDTRGVGVIVCPVPAGDGLAAALRDRIEKAARPR